jgi:pimeloyl-ACP methyl ester carboxylesterase
MKKAVFILMICVAFAQTTIAKTYVLVHGAMIDGTAWYKIVKPLQDAGNKVVVVNLPSHGKDNTKISDVNYNLYLSTIKDSINAQSEKVILVGHSMAGLLISSIASEMPEKIESLVYVAAFIPQNGESVFKLNGGDAKSKFSANIIVANDQASATLKLDKIKEVFCNDCSDEDVSLLKLSHKAQPLAPLAQEIVLNSKNLDSVTKYIVQTSNDNAITFEYQKKCATNAKNVKKTFVSNSGHSPFISKPKELIKILLSI